MPRPGAGTIDVLSDAYDPPLNSRYGANHGKAPAVRNWPANGLLLRLSERKACTCRWTFAACARRLLRYNVCCAADATQEAIDQI